MTNLMAEQLKGQLKSLANKNHADARVLLRLFMMERFLERLSLSKYSEIYRTVFNYCPVVVFDC